MILPYVYKEQKTTRLTFKAWGVWVFYAFVVNIFTYHVSQFADSCHSRPNGRDDGFWAGNQPMMFVLVFVHDIQKVLYSWNLTPPFFIICM